MDRITKPIERFLRTDTSYIFQNSAWLSVANIVQTIIALGLSIIFARYLTKDLYGDYRYILSIIGMLGVFALPGVSLALTRSVARGFAGTFRESARIIFLSTFLITLGGFSTALYFFLQGNIPLAESLLVIALAAPFIDGLGTWRAYLDGRKEFRKKTFLNIAGYLFYGILIASAVGTFYIHELSHTEGLFLLIGAYAIGYAIPNIISFLLTLRTTPVTEENDPASLRYGLHLSLLDIPSTIASHIDSFLLFTYLGPSAVAVYAFAIVPVQRLRGFLDIIPNIAFPKIVGKMDNPAEWDTFKQTITRRTYRAVTITTLIVLTYVLVAPLLFNILFPRYTESVLLSQIFALSLVLYPFNIFGVILKAEGTIKNVYAFKILSPVIKIVAVFALIPWFGIWGAIIGHILGRSINQLLGFIIFKFKE
ncbi:MAG: hypothetical protein COU90_02020 [Candidatus Ryanbacteria bacterium CG10_big_fil_rev_8_21_14_0_10_43_42]|uniref:Polysaccharide biosynthesis protein C-terminal domain-containing protein n=1 Tax=Candidatus Ryanbacteria bacterium CG10_big_fil_rev_8_21_14_0_10_43_42 TaxID=1974864 RepID=A0A2M8KXD4_9BACT|nr:MAG: hypothetical protein COU90_02020 [Candidatus Ryanbacteria bacterium CG10_big_fil_rev_8_21_14_0_10_43_42]